MNSPPRSFPWRLCRPWQQDQKCRPPHTRPLFVIELIAQCRRLTDASPLSASGDFLSPHLTIIGVGGVRWAMRNDQAPPPIRGLPPALCLSSTGFTVHDAHTFGLRSNAIRASFLALLPASTLPPHLTERRSSRPILRFLGQNDDLRPILRFWPKTLQKHLKSPLFWLLAKSGNHVRRISGTLGNRPFLHDLEAFWGGLPHFPPKIAIFRHQRKIQRLQQPLQFF